MEIRVVPDDKDIAKFLQETLEANSKEAAEVTGGLEETLEQTIRDGEPPIFAYGKLLNYLASLPQPELIEILSAVLWQKTGH